jgi:phosphohistidine phosphatase
LILYIIRHAWAAEPGDVAWPDDRLRPLTANGRRRFAKLIKTLVGRGFAPELIATSPLVRCRQTAEIVAKAVPGKPKIVQREELAPGSDLEGLLGWTILQSDHCGQLAWVGHAPDVGRLAATLIGQPEGLLRLAKGGVASIRFDGPPKAGAGELWWLVTAKVLGC